MAIFEADPIWLEVTNLATPLTLVNFVALVTARTLNEYFVPAEMPAATKYFVLVPVIILVQDFPESAEYSTK